MSNSLRYFDNIRYGNFKDLEILVNPEDRSIWIAQSTLAKMIGWDNLDSTGIRQKLKAKSFINFVKNAGVNPFTQKTAKPSQDKGLTGVKQFEARDILGRPNKVNALSFDTFLQVVYWEAFEGKGDSQAKAKSLLLAGFADSFSSLILEQCGIKLTEHERQETVSFYLIKYHAFFDWIRDTHLEMYGEKPSNDYYREINVMTNMTLFDIPSFNHNRIKNADNEQLRKIESLQMFFMDSKWSKQKGDPKAIFEKFLSNY